MPTIYNKVTVGNTTLIDLSQDTVTDASHIVSGHTGHLADGTQVAGTGGGGGGTYQAKTNINPTTTSQTITPDSGYDALSSVQINAMPSGTAGTPTATKGTVSNHSVSVTPSVTNTTGYITGSTKTGTAVTVSASELVSGSETKTANGTYDVTNLAQLIVNVSGGGGSGLVYESGTYTPASNATKPTISFANTHSTLPLYIMMADSTGTYSNTSYTNYTFNFINYYGLTGEKMFTATNTFIYATCYYEYRQTNADTFSTANTKITRSPSDTGTGTNDYGNWVTTTGFMPNTNNTSRYWRSGRSYKWIAVWAPTT